MVYGTRLILAAGLCLLAGPLQARITAVDVLEQTPFAGGASFGPAGPYVRIRAVAHGELDPASPSNAGIALLDKAPRNARGLVEYDTDLFILRPADPARGSGVLLYDVTNRGNKFIPSWLNDAPEPGGLSVNDPRTVEDAGNAFTLRRGTTMVWSGWQPEAPLANNGMRIRVPIATDQGRPIVQRIRDEFQVGTRGPEHVRRHTLPYPVADVQTAVLTVRARQADAPEVIPPNQVHWVDHQTIELEPYGTELVPRHIYELTYDATAPTVDGIGFAAVRDVVAYLRRQDGTRHTLGFGVSLSGRFLRHFLDLGMNRDEDGGRVFDGLLPHIAGAGKVFANEPFAMPGRTATQHEDRFYPEVWAPVGYPGLLRDPATDPLIIETNTSTEYWQKGASLVHGGGPLPATVRMFLVAGVQHGGHAGTPATPGFCANPRNPTSAGPALRALLVALEDWVVRGVLPPDSLVPTPGFVAVVGQLWITLRQSDAPVDDAPASFAGRRPTGPSKFVSIVQAGVPAAAIRMPSIPGVTWAPQDNAIGRPVGWVWTPTGSVDGLPTLVAPVDADGNEVVGMRLPHLQVPLGTYTGVNVYRDLPTELCDRDGIYVPFARTKAERERAGDPRPSLEERYRGREDYVARVTAAADALVAVRLLLREDRDRYVATAREAPGF